MIFEVYRRIVQMNLWVRVSCLCGANYLDKCIVATAACNRKRDKRTETSLRWKIAAPEQYVTEYMTEVFY